MAGAAAFAASLSFPAAAKTDSFAVVKLMLFSCPVCRAAETIDAWARQTLRDSVAYVHAPIPAEPDQDARERYYYAVREQGGAAAQAVLQAFYKGTQDRQLPLADDAQCYAWLQAEVGTSVDWLRLREAASKPDAKTSVRKAISLLGKSGTTDVPTYLVLRNGGIAKMVAPLGNLADQRRELDAVFDALQLKG